MEERFDPKDINHLISDSKSMHDEIMTHITYDDGRIVIEYGEIEDCDEYHHFHKVTVTYILSEIENDLSLSARKIARSGWKAERFPSGIEELNTWRMVMYKYSIDVFGEMTLHFSIDRDKKYADAELSFTPVSISYVWE